MSPRSPACTANAPCSAVSNFPNSPISLEPLHAPAAFVDRAARILHANSAFYALLEGADLGEADWIGAFEKPERIQALIDAAEKSHQLSIARLHQAARKLKIWLVASANAYPMAGRQETVRLVSLHCAADAVRLHLALRDEHPLDGAQACAVALNRHAAFLASENARRRNVKAPEHPTRLVLNALAAAPVLERPAAK